MHPPRPWLGSCRRPSPSTLVTGCPHNTAETCGPLVPAADAASQEWLAGTPCGRVNPARHARLGMMRHAVNRHHALWFTVKSDNRLS
ncbi:hypothetical protein Dvul_2957 (plasmid) [Nitratidesulfovibrio vulgaris DP4]|uniref:Uncharacterized protein n=1 Tax=Nitratidesulfovibrio vulgaris (strain DP4) TaxID=391774 RepID=A0A0H3AC11_NITV4|nr:hypothetical protein Dvul_2957 [Nitratidesulfovibrio vulgaris DP4]